MRRASSWLAKRLAAAGFVATLAALTAFASAPAAAAACPWDDWEAFKRATISTDGRVVDASTERQVTVSEGQAYALFFALAANDRPAFETLLGWTENNLARGDLTANLPAWIWGRRDDGTWGVIDGNAASDADLWIAYALLEAGRLWRERRYTALGTVLARRIVREETAVLPGLGRTVLPGPVGFRLEPGAWRLNPSYVPLQVMRRIAAALPEDAEWKALTETSARMILGTAPRGFSPDWAEYREGNGFRPDAATKAEGAYNAIRVYLWAGMLPAGEPLRDALVDKFRPLADYVAAKGYPPERVDTQAGTFGPNAGNAGFSAAVAPYLAAAGRADLARAQAQRNRGLAAREPPGYYSQVLTLFGLGFLDGRYRFDADGTLVPAWTAACPAPR